MKILHIIAGLPSAGGMSELVPLLALEQHRLGHEVTVATVGQVKAVSALQAERAGVRVVRYRACWPHFLYYSLEMQRKLATWVMSADLVHVHGCWTFPVWWGCHCALKYQKPYVRSPHGCLAHERLKLSAWKKGVAGLLFERRYFERSAVIHATAESEASGVESYLKSGASEAVIPNSAGEPVHQAALEGMPRVAVVQNGVDPNAFKGCPDKEALDRRWPGCRGKRVVLFMSRLHPIKGLDLLVSAWARVLNQQPAHNGGPSSSLHHWHLLIAGPDERGCQASVVKAVCDAGLDSCVTFCGPLYGADKYGVMATANLFVLPTRNENFGIVVAEALACGVPVITTKGAPWQELLGSPASSLVHYCESALVVKPEGGSRKADVFPTNELMNSRTNELAASGRCGWWVEIGEEPLAEALKEAINLTDDVRHAMGGNGRRLVEAKYTWPTIAKAMEGVYEASVARNRKP